MAETLGAVVGVVAFGLNLATTLQTYTELTREANDALHDVVFEVNATASALRQLQAIVDADKAVSHLDDSPARVLKDSGVREIESLAAKCEAVYKTIVKLVQKASGSESDPPNATAASQHALDPASLKPMTVLQRLRWPWLTPRIERCQQQLRWLKISLLVTLQVANLALQQMRRDNDPISTQANSLTDVVQTLQERQVELAKKLAGFSQTSLEDAANLRAWKAAYGTETGFSEASSIPGRKSHLTAVGHVTGKPKDINGVEQAVKTEANPKPGTISGVGTAPVQATDDRDAPVDELKKPASTRDMGIGTGSKTLEPIRNPSVSEQVGVHSSYAHAFHAPGVALTNAVEPEKRGLPEAGAAVATNPEPPRATMATTSQVAHEPASLGIQRMAPEPLPKAAHVKMHSKASEPSKKRRTIPLFPRFRKVPDLQSQLFGEDDKFSHDSPSRTLGAFVAELGMIRTVPFGHDRLVYGLNQVHKHRLIATWAKYLNSTAEKQALIGKTTDMAKRMSHRAMSLLTFHEIERPNGSEAILAFFALNQLQEPVTFIDFAQRRHSIPFGACQSHDSFHEFVLEMHKDKADLPESLSKGEFERQARYGSFEAVHPMLWSASVNPGTVLRMAGHVPVPPYPYQWPLHPQTIAPIPANPNYAGAYNPSSYANPYSRAPGPNSSSPGLVRHPANAPLPSRPLSTMRHETKEGVDVSLSEMTSDDAIIQEIETELAPPMRSEGAGPGRRRAPIAELLSHSSRVEGVANSIAMEFSSDDARSASLLGDEVDSASDDGVVVDFSAEAAKGVVSVTELLSRLTNAPGPIG